MEFDMIDISREMEEMERKSQHKNSQSSKLSRIQQPSRSKIQQPNHSGIQQLQRRNEHNLRKQDYVQQDRIRKKKLAKKRKQRRKRRAIVTVMLTVLGVLCILLVRSIIRDKSIRNIIDPERREFIQSNDSKSPDIVKDYLTVNEYSRPGETLPKVKNIFVHYTANAGTNAAQNRSYFENLGMSGERSASAHFIIGYEGEIVQCIPLDEIGYAVKTRNYDSISIECCYLEEDGKFTDSTYQSLLKLSAWLLKEYKLTPEDMLRHYDCGGKKCPLYYVEHEDAWQQFKDDLTEYVVK